MSTVHCVHIWLTFAVRGPVYRAKWKMYEPHITRVRLLLFFFLSTFALVPFRVIKKTPIDKYLFQIRNERENIYFRKWFCSIFVGLTRTRLAFGVGSEDLLEKLAKINIKIEHTSFFLLWRHSVNLWVCVSACALRSLILHWKLQMPTKPVSVITPWQVCRNFFIDFTNSRQNRPSNVVWLATWIRFFFVAFANWMSFRPRKNANNAQFYTYSYVSVVSFHLITNVDRRVWRGIRYIYVSLGDELSHKIHGKNSTRQNAFLRNRIRPRFTWYSTLCCNHLLVCACVGCKNTIDC